MDMINIYTDGSCHGNPGPGGWAVVVFHDSTILNEFGGSQQNTTNNQMELTALLKALQISKEYTQPVFIHTDSNYCSQGITKWIINWKKNGWKTANGKPVKNEALWKAIDNEYSDVDVKRNVHIKWVKAHCGDPKNDRADELANKYATLLP